MWNFNPVELGMIALRTAIVYIVLLTALKLTGKRQVGQLTPFDLVVLLLVSNAVQNAMTGPDVSVSGGVVAAVTLLAINKIVSLARIKIPVFGKLVTGEPTILVNNSTVNMPALSREGMTMDDLLEAMREHDCDSLDKVQLAVLEVDGSVSIVHKDSNGKLHHTRKKMPRHHQHANS